MRKTKARYHVAANGGQANGQGKVFTRCRQWIKKGRIRKVVGKAIARSVDSKDICANCWRSL